MPLIIGITGSIASGKSTACEYLSSRGAVYCDADKLVHRMYDPGKPAFDRIIGAFGQDVVGEDGYIDRRILGSKVFGNAEEMARLTGAIGDIQAEVCGVMDSWRTSLSPNAIGLMEAVNFIEAGYGRFSDFTWLFAVDNKLAIQRLKDRNNLTTEMAEQRLSSQRAWQDREPAADLVTLNNGSQEELIELVEMEISRIRFQWTAGTLPPSKYMPWWNAQEHWTNQP